MRTIKIAVLCMLLGAGPAVADDTTLGESASVEAPAADYIAPSKDVPLYVPLTEDQQLLPISAADAGVDYYPGIEKSTAGTWPKEITEQVPAQ